MIAVRYLARTFLVYGGAALATLLTLYLVFDLVEVYRLLDAAGGGLTLILRYLADRLPGALWHVLPAAVLLGLLLSLGSLARRGELTALAAAGHGPGRPLAALLLLAGGVAALTFAVGETWLPGANRRIAAIFEAALRADRPRERVAPGRWLRSGQRFLHVQRLGPTVDEAQGILLLELGPGFRPRRRVDARSMSWREGQWWLRDVVTHQLDCGGRRCLPGHTPPPVHSRLGAQRLGLSPEPLRAGWERAEILAGSELAELVRWKRAQGQNTDSLELTLAERRSWPLLPILFALVAVPIGLRPRRPSGMLASLGRSLVVGAGFAVAVFSAQALARAGLLTPTVAGWLPTILLALTGALFTGTMLWPRRARS